MTIDEMIGHLTAMRDQLGKRAGGTITALGDAGKTVVYFDCPSCTQSFTPDVLERCETVRVRTTA